MNYLALVPTEGSLTRWTEEGQSSLVGTVENSTCNCMLFWSSGIARLVLGIEPIGVFPRTPSFANLSSVDAPDPLTGHSYLLHTPHDFELTRGLSCMQHVPLPSTLPSHCLSSSLCNLMRRRPIHLLPLA